MLAPWLIAVVLVTQVEAQAQSPQEPVKSADAAQQALETRPSIVTLSGVMTLDEARASLEKQTGNKIIDFRQRNGQEVPNPQLKFDIVKAPFWKAFDAILDSAEVDLNNFSGNEGLAISERSGGDVPRSQRATYAGPLRIEPKRILSERMFDQQKSSSTKLELEVSWEPRLTPIAFSQPIAKLQATDDKGQNLKVDFGDPTLDAPSKGGTAVEMVIPFESPPRTSSKIASIKGAFNIVLPGPVEEFSFENLTEALKPQFKGVEKKKAAVSVTLDHFRKNNEIWEVFMRLKFETNDDVMESHSGKFLQNDAFIIGPDKKRIDNAGFHSFMQNKNELGMAYQFELPDNPEGCTFVYKTPSSIHSVTIPYELKDLTLP
ncbi:MAG TPA: hypothetical protein VGJ15_13980 [Pirellulales bacterium]